ncbi:hypothetical protein F66182_6263 [Fusarium sp. NRRL 66182]|nr:hypothetical protein F66182_6263 [Fusarium sp. NRRL 66182]
MAEKTVDPHEPSSIQDEEMADLVPLNVSELGPFMIRKIEDQMASEVFKLAGRDPKEHQKCFEACVQTVAKTHAIDATDFAEWESNATIANSLDEFNRANKAARSHLFYMVQAPTAVAVAVALNHEQINIEKDTNLRIMNLFSKGEIWAWLGTAIDVWPTTGNARFLVKPHEEVSEPPSVGKHSFGQLCVRTPESVSPYTVLYSHLHLILNSADAFVIQESLPRKVRVVLRSRGENGQDDE